MAIMSPITRQAWGSPVPGLHLRETHWLMVEQFLGMPFEQTPAVQVLLTVHLLPS
jgi:hypothetical protein